MAGNIKNGEYHKPVKFYNVMRTYGSLFMHAGLLILLIIIMSTGTQAYAKKRFTYVGVSECKPCHNESKILNQYSIWIESPHAKSVKSLTTSKAGGIAEKVSVENPSSSLKCLKCHTTGGGRYEITKNEGVGCESCHGPGSGYYEMSNHVDLQYRKNGYRKAKKLGMYPILKYEENLKKREKLCLYCHRKKRPCWPVTAKDISEKRLTIQVIDKLRKGDVNFFHSLRRY